MKKRKLNNRGMTAVELLISFVLISIVITALFSMLSSYKNKQQTEFYKEKIYTYKNLLTKEINDDLIKKRLIYANTSSFEQKINGQMVNITQVLLSLQDGSVKCLQIKSAKAFDIFNEDERDEVNYPSAKDKDDYFVISYGDYVRNASGSYEFINEIEYPIPDLGKRDGQIHGKTFYDLRINNVRITTNDLVLNIYVGFYHPNFGTRYGIDIVCPINF